VISEGVPTEAAPAAPAAPSATWTPRASMPASLSW